MSEQIQTPRFKLAVYAKGNADSGKLALVLPGLLDTKDYAHMRSLVDFLAGRGYYAVSFDPPGSWGSAGSIMNYTITNYLRAIDDLVDHYGDKPTLLLGHSLGGFMAALAGGRSPYTLGVVSIMSGYTFVRPINGEDVAARLPVAVWREAGVRLSDRDLPRDPSRKRHFELPFSFVEDSLQYNSLNGLKTLAAPKLFILGEHDLSVLPEFVRTAYETAAEPKQLHALNSDHNYRLHPELIEQVNEVIGEFLSGNKL